MSSHGPFRKWLVLLVAWITCIGLIGYVAVFLEVPRRFYYVYEVRSDVESWQEGRSPNRAPIYDVMRSPSQEKLSPEFLPIGETATLGVSEWNKHVDEGPILEFNFFDGTALHLSSLLTQKDRDYLVAAFWDERWSRWALWTTVAAPWIVAALLPPPLLLGALWLVRRLKRN